MSREKRIFVIAGPNGAGKTTFAIEFNWRQFMIRHSNGREDRETGATLRALRRAARRARELGARTGTPVYVPRQPHG